MTVEGIVLQRCGPLRAMITERQCRLNRDQGTFSCQECQGLISAEDEMAQICKAKQCEKYATVAGLCLRHARKQAPELAEEYVRKQNEKRRGGSAPGREVADDGTAGVAGIDQEGAKVVAECAAVAPEAGATGGAEVIEALEFGELLVKVEEAPVILCAEESIGAVPDPDWTLALPCNPLVRLPMPEERAVVFPPDLARQMVEAEVLDGHVIELVRLGLEGRLLLMAGGSP